VILGLVMGEPIRIDSELPNLVASVEYASELGFCPIARAETATEVQRRLGRALRRDAFDDVGVVIHG
jgi:hypothetical protein